MNEEAFGALQWRAETIDAIAREHAARLQLVRCGLRTSLTRRRPDGTGADTTDRATPQRLWSAHEPDGTTWWLMAWAATAPAPAAGGTPAALPCPWGVARYTPAEGMLLVSLTDASSLQLEGIARVLGTPGDALLGQQVEWIGATAIDEPQAEGPPDPPPVDDISALVALWHEDLQPELVREGEPLRYRPGPPLTGFDAWRLPSNRRLLGPDDPMRKLLVRAIARQVSNFRLGDDAELQLAWATPVPTYEGFQLIEIVDRRPLRARRTELLFDPDPDRPLIVPMSGDSGALHWLNARQQSRWNWTKQFETADGAARYLDLFVRSIYLPGASTYFELVCDAGRDLRLHPRMRLDNDTSRLRQALLVPGALGLWVLEPQRPRRPHEHFFSALMVSSRHLFIAALKVCLVDGVPHVEMLADEPCRGSANLPIEPLTLDRDAEFVLSLRARSPDQSEWGPAEAEAGIAVPEPAGEDARPSVRPGSTSLRGSIDGGTFAQRFGDDGHASLPRGEDISPRAARREPALEVADAVSLRGRRDLHGSRVVIGVHFRGPVDLRDLLLAGSLTFAYCIFDAPLDLDDAEIDGSLSLKGSELLGGLSLRGAIVRGAVDLSAACFYPDPDPRRSNAPVLTGATVEGDLDLRGTGEVVRKGLAPVGLRLDGCHVKGDLLMGAGAGGYREPMMLRRVSGAGIRIDGSLRVLGACSVPERNAAGGHVGQPALRFPGARIGGDVEVRPHERGVPDRPFFEQPLDSDELDEDRSMPRLAELALDGAQIQGSLLATGCVIRSEPPGAGLLSLHNARIQGDLWLQARFVARGASDSRTGIGKEPYHWPVKLDALMASGLELAGRLMLGGVEIRNDLLLSEARIEGMVDVRPAWVAGSVGDVLALPGGRRRPAASLRTRVGGQVNLAVMRCESHMRMQGVQIHGTVVLLNTVIGPFSLDPALLKQGERDLPEHNRWEIVPSQIGGLQIVGSEIKGWLRMRLLQVRGRPMTRGQRGLRIDTSTVDGDVSLWQVAYARDLAESDEIDEAGTSMLLASLTSWCYAAAVIGDVAIRRCTLKADCSLSLTKASGAIDLSDTTVQGDLMLASLHRHGEASEGDARLLAALASDHDPSNWLQRTDCTGLSLEALGCDGDVRIDGVRIRRAAGVPGAVVIEADHLRVEGDFVLSDEIRDEPGRVAPGGSPARRYSSLETSGCRIVLDDATLNRLRLNDGLAAAGGVEVGLSRAAVRTFEFTWLPQAALSPGRAAVTFDLLGAEVAEWRLCDRSAQAQGREARDNDSALFERLIDRPADVPEPVWTAMEDYLRRRGAEDEADDLYRRMRERKARTRRPIGWRRRGLAVATGLVIALAALAALIGSVLLSKFGPLGWALGVVAAAALLLQRPVRDLIQRRTIGYGTMVSPVAIAWVLLLLFALPVYLAPQNFELSNAARAAGKLDAALPPEADRVVAGLYKSQQATDEWSVGHALAMALQHHVPIIGMTPLDDWEARNDRDGDEFVTRLCLSIDLAALPNIRCTAQEEVRGLAPQAFATYMQALNWIAWPVFLTFMALKLWRGRPGASQ